MGTAFLGLCPYTEPTVTEGCLETTLTCFQTCPLTICEGASRNLVIRHSRTLCVAIGVPVSPLCCLRHASIRSEVGTQMPHSCIYTEQLQELLLFDHHAYHTVCCIKLMGIIQCSPRPDLSFASPHRWLGRSRRPHEHLPPALPNMTHVGITRVGSVSGSLSRCISPRERGLLSSARD